MADLDPAPDPDTDPPIVFGGYVKGARINERDGELIINVAVPLEDKYHALPATDHPGVMYDFTLEPRVYQPEDFEDVDTAEMGVINHHD